LYPLVRRAFGDRLSVGRDYYTVVCAPLVWTLLVGLVIGPARVITRTYVAANIAVSIAATVIAAQFGSFPAALTLGLGATAFMSSIVASIQHPRRRAGAFIVHSGFALLLVGIGGSALGASRTVALQPGERVRFEGYDIALESTSAESHDQFARLQARFLIERGDNVIATLTPSLDIYEQRGIALPETSYRSSPLDDVMIAVRNVEDDETVLVQITVRPLMWWLWWGGLLMTIGGLWSLFARVRAGSSSVALAREQPRERVLL
jgi:cytochrome c-type biogenesis protein CcmF